MKKTPTTLSDIAKKLNISISTVSRALHDHPAINAETKREVIRLARELNYHPNLLAINLLAKKTNTIGIIVPEITSYFFSSVINGIQDLVNHSGYHLMISQTEESFGNEKHILEAMAKVRVDGFLISPSSETNDAEHLNQLIDNGIPVVLFDRDCSGFSGDKVLVDDYDGAFQAVEYLIKTGCKRIAHITGPSDLSISQHRLHGYLNALAQYQIARDEQLIVRVGGFTPEYGVEAANQILQLSELPDAIFAINDGVAIGAMYVIKEAGIKIPGQISVVGFDDEPHSQYFIPPLTSVWQPVYDMGMLSARILLNKLKGNQSNQACRFELLKPELIIRSSSRKLQ
jgi:DNA-binding LacI/PurR family transcriptional regulator